MTSARPGIGVMIFGVFLSLTGGIGYAACAPGTGVTSAPAGCGSLAIVLTAGVLLVVGGVVAAVVGYSLRTEPVRRAATRIPAARPKPSPADSWSLAVPPSPTFPREKVEVACPYCGNLRESSQPGCSVCGAWSVGGAPNGTSRSV